MTIAKTTNKYVQLYNLVLAHYHKLLPLVRARDTIEWDMNTFMPMDAGPYKGSTLAHLDVMAHNLLLEPNFVKNVETLYSALQSGELNKAGFSVFQKGDIRLLYRAIERNKKLPERFVKEFSKLTSDAFNVWRKAKKEDDFAAFAPYLEKIFKMARQKSEYLGYKDHPYDPHIDAYEEGITTQDVREYFNKLIPEFKNLLNSIQSAPGYKPESPLEKEPYNKAKMRKLNHKVLNYMLFDPAKSRLDVAPHPFTTTLGKNDVRITTWYHPADFRRSLSATIHEWGHALHALGLADEAWDTPSEDHSYAIAESQSRFMENVVGRNRAFLELWLKDMQNLGENRHKYTLDDFYHYFNLVRPSLIRVEADEVTYHFHIYIRFEVEVKLLEGDLSVADLPDFWNSRFEQLLGIQVPNYRQGVLQDVQWSRGSIGYFPTYSMGTVLSMQMAQVIMQKLGDISKLVVTQQGFKKIREFLQQTVHQYGGALPPKELIKQSFGKYLDVELAIKYLREKYVE